MGELSSSYQFDIRNKISPFSSTLKTNAAALENVLISRHIRDQRQHIRVVVLWLKSNDVKSFKAGSKVSIKFTLERPL